ncbi:MAG: tRNA pseudouridine(38-40) synthase TruA [Treponema sp.]|jgi:tRNA pseudouridine38-40 synthase|nr:tRNA pseudouridine(38-40) synthase TruA [Treponema sp.]
MNEEARGTDAEAALEPDGESRNIRLLIAYDGTDFSGWQKQGASPELPRCRTVQGVIEKALERIHKRKIALTGAGRTDAGVHAAGQTAHFHSPLRSMAAERFVPALNSLLPQDLRILRASECLHDFHARFDARARSYRYYFICGRHGLPHELRYSLQLWRRPSVNRLNAYARRLLGELDCSVFAGAGDKSLSRSRSISRAHFFTQGDSLVFEIRANAFLWKMVRSIAGTLLSCEEKGLSEEAVGEIIRSRDRTRAGPTLPPRGLFLWHIDYYRE